MGRDRKEGVILMSGYFQGLKTDMEMLVHAIRVGV